MVKAQTMSLEERLIGEISTSLLEIKGAIGTLSSNKDEYIPLMGEKFEDYNKWMGMISNGAQRAEGLLQDLSVLYNDKNATPAKSNMLDAVADYLKPTVAKLRIGFKKKSNGSASAETSHAAEVTERKTEGTIIHDINNGLAYVMWFSELLLMDTGYESLLGQKYETFNRNLKLINTGANQLVAKLGELSGFYRAQEQKVEPVPASTLGNEAITYLIVHIDDQKESRDAVYEALSSSSNVIPPTNGLFGHEGIKVRYI